MSAFFYPEPDESASPLIHTWPAVVGVFMGRPERIKTFEDKDDVARFMLACDHQIDEVITTPVADLVRCAGCNSTFLAGGPGWQGR